MKTRSVDVYLVLTILMLSVVPLLVSFVLVEEVLDSAISISIDKENSDLMREYQNDLKTLGKFDPENESVYRDKFYQIEDKLTVLGDSYRLKSVLRNTYLTYYIVLFFLVLLIAVVTASLLSRKVAGLYKQLLSEDIKKEERIRELSYFDQWKEIAGKLAHEIKTPLTPIDMMVSSLVKAYEKDDKGAFKNHLIGTAEVVSEEIVKLREMVNHFSKFSKLPVPNLAAINFSEYIRTYVRQYQNAWPAANISLNLGQDCENLLVKADCLLINQCISNLVNNAVEANPDKKSVKIRIELTKRERNHMEMRIVNDGISINPKSAGDIFKMYYSTKKGGNNMGLGLPIVRKILFDHGGDIHCCARQDGAEFVITLPVEEC